MRLLLFITALAVLLVSFTAAPETAPKENLSDYDFFTGPLADLRPAENVLAYDLNAPLFSDYAEKQRFISLPAGAKMRYRADGSFEFPAGATIIKHFYYHHDEAKPEMGRRIVETRLLIKEAAGWKALTYIWNDAQTDAALEVAGASFPVSWRSADGQTRALEYVVPNVNQCKGCHSYDGAFVPLGPTAAQLNRELPGGENQLTHWRAGGQLDAPADFDPARAPRLADYRVADGNYRGHPASGDYPTPATALARAYLEGNCAHCHNEHGPASTSGLFLNATERMPERLGVGKPPVAAGRGSGKRKFSIVPGKPDQSILMYRMENNDPGIRMPELGRQMAHTEGIELIRAWIRGMQ